MSDTQNVTLTRMANVNTAREFGFATMYANLAVITAAGDKVAMARANLVIVAWESGDWTKIASPADESGKTPAFATWADFCKTGLGISAESQISGAARKHIVATLRDRDDNQAEVADMSAATGANARTIARDVAALGLANENRAAAGAASQAAAGNTGDKSEESGESGNPPAGENAAQKVAAKIAKFAVSDLATYIINNVDAGELASLLGAEYVAKLTANAGTAGDAAAE